MATISIHLDEIKGVRVKEFNPSMRSQFATIDLDFDGGQLTMFFNDTAKIKNFAYDVLRSCEQKLVQISEPGEKTECALQSVLDAN